MTVAKGMVYSFNAENRLIEAAPQNPQQGSVKSTYIYDYMGRRAQKTLYTYSSGSWQKQKDVSFIYDGWNMVKESEKTSDSSPEVPVYYVWGLDLSQSMQGAGGVGGLIASVKSGNEYLYSYDANGNVGQMVKSADGSIAARYEYDPFGRTIFREGPMASENPYRFSSKYLDGETGLYYYGLRLYSPEFARWINRDPSGELDGYNNYRFVDNSPLFYTDMLGLWRKADETGKERLWYYRESSKDTLKTLADLIGLDIKDVKEWAKIEWAKTEDDTKDTLSPCLVSVPNVWIVADIMRGGDVADSVINMGGTLGFKYVPDGAMRKNVDSINDLVPEIQKNIGNILGFVMYAHGDEFGYVYNIANHLGGMNVDRIHTRLILNSLDKNKYRIAKAYPMQCYSVIQGEQKSYNDAEWQNTKYYQDLKMLGYNPSVVNIKDSRNRVVSSAMRLKIDLLAEWRQRAVSVDGYFGMNVLGFDTGR